MLPGFTPSDSDLIGELLARAFPIADEGSVAEGLEEALCSVLPRLEGAFSLGLIDATRLYAVRDPNGFRPLCLGRLEWPDEEGWAVASESPALATVGASFVREIEPGELVVIGQDGVRSLRPFPPARVVPKLCVFEFVYFARPDAELYGREVHAARRRMGERLADESPVEADLVIGVPDSGVPAAEGFSVRSGIPFGQGLVKNRYIGRTFIAPTVAARSDGVRRKLNPLRESVGGKRLVVIDDSIVRGTTTSQIVRVLREAEHARSTSGSRRRRFVGPVFTGSTPPCGRSCSPPFRTPRESPPNSVRIPSRTCRWKGCFRPSASRGPSSVRLVFPASTRLGFPCPRRTPPALRPAEPRCRRPGPIVWSPATGGVCGRDRRRSGDLALFQARALPAELPDHADDCRRVHCARRATLRGKVGQRSDHSADLTGFEPATSGLTGQRALQAAPQVLVRSSLGSPRSCVPGRAGMPADPRR